MQMFSVFSAFFAGGQRQQYHCYDGGEAMVVIGYGGAWEEVKSPIIRSI